MLNIGYLWTVVQNSKITLHQHRSNNMTLQLRRYDAIEKLCSSKCQKYRICTVNRGYYDNSIFSDAQAVRSPFILRGWVVGWCDGPGQPSSAGESYDLDGSRASCACSRCGWGLFGHFYSHLSFVSSVSPSLGDCPI